MFFFARRVRSLGIIELMNVTIDVRNAFTCIVAGAVLQALQKPHIGVQLEQTKCVVSLIH